MDPRANVLGRAGKKILVGQSHYDDWEDDDDDVDGEDDANDDLDLCIVMSVQHRYVLVTMPLPRSETHES